MGAYSLDCYNYNAGARLHRHFYFYRLPTAEKTQGCSERSGMERGLRRWTLDSVC